MNNYYYFRIKIMKKLLKLIFENGVMTKQQHYKCYENHQEYFI